MRQEDIAVLLVLFGLAAVALVVMNSSSSVSSMIPASNVLMHNSEEYEWVDYRGKNRTLRVRRSVERGS